MFVEDWRIIAHYCVDVMRKIAHIVTINRTQKSEHESNHQRNQHSVTEMNPDLEKAPKEVRDWLNRTEKATGLKKSIIVAGILMSYALKSKEEEKSSTTKKTAVIPVECTKRGNI